MNALPLRRLHAQRWRSLTEGEVAMASLLFRDAIDYARARIYGRRYMPFQLKNCATTPNGSLYFQVEQTNSATRLYALIEKAQRQNSGISSLAACAITFGIEPSSASVNPHEVLDQLRLMHEEIGHLRRQMARTSFSADLYNPALQQISDLLGVTNLAACWNSCVHAVRDQDLLALRI